MFHCAHQVTEIGVVGLIAGNMNEIGVRKVFGNSFHWVHKSEGCTKDHIEAFGCKAAEDLFRFCSFRDILDINHIYVVDVITDVFGTVIMRL